MFVFVLTLMSVAVGCVRARVCVDADVGSSWVWVCGFVSLWVCGFVGLWVCGFVGLWVCGFVGLWVCVFCIVYF